MKPRRLLSDTSLSITSGCVLAGIGLVGMCQELTLSSRARRCRPEGATRPKDLLFGQRTQAGPSLRSGRRRLPQDDNVAELTKLLRCPVRRSGVAAVEQAGPAGARRSGRRENG